MVRPPPASHLNMKRGKHPLRHAIPLNTLNGETQYAANPLRDRHSAASSVGREARREMPALASLSCIRTTGPSQIGLVGAAARVSPGAAIWKKIIGSSWLSRPGVLLVPLRRGRTVLGARPNEGKVAASGAEGGWSIVGQAANGNLGRDRRCCRPQHPSAPVAFSRLSLRRARRFGPASGNVKREQIKTRVYRCVMFLARSVPVRLRRAERVSDAAMITVLREAVRQQVIADIRRECMKSRQREGKRTRAVGKPAFPIGPRRRVAYDPDGG